jgi:hypothetical protein
MYLPILKITFFTMAEVSEVRHDFDLFLFKRLRALGKCLTIETGCN